MQHWAWVEIDLTTELFCCVICSADIKSAIEWSSMAYPFLQKTFGMQ